jgi:RimJ/RimL family protein N-acetyltransferase
LMLERNPKAPSALMETKVLKEIKQFSDGKEYGLFVTKVKKEIVGFCRFYFSRGLAKEKIKYPFKEGCYCMGMMVHSKWRRQNIARYMATLRQEWIARLGVNKIYSVVATDNPSSIDMHLSFGFQEIERAKGFMNISFDCGEGILFEKEIAND